jgi:hypothetical protein
MTIATMLMVLGIAMTLVAIAKDYNINNGIKVEWWRHCWAAIAMVIVPTVPMGTSASSNNNSNNKIELTVKSLMACIRQEKILYACAHNLNYTHSTQ